MNCPKCGSNEIKLIVGNLYRCFSCGHKFNNFEPIKCPRQIKEEENEDQSVYSDDPKDTQEDDMEEDLGFLDDNDMGW